MKIGSKLNIWFLIPCFTALLISGVFAYWLPYGEEIFLLNQFRVEPYNSVFKLLTYFGEWQAWIVLILIAGLAGRKNLLVLSVSAILILLITLSFKQLAQKNRPITWAMKEHPNRELVVVPDIYINRAKTSFPSGHTCSAFAVFFLFSQLIPERYQKFGFLLGIIAISVGFSRVFLVQHFLIDVLAGAILGLILGWLTWFVYKAKTQD